MSSTLLGSDSQGVELTIDDGDSEPPVLLMVDTNVNDGVGLELTPELADEIKEGLERWAHMQRIKGRR